VAPSEKIFLHYLKTAESNEVDFIGIAEHKWLMDIMVGENSLVMCRWYHGEKERMNRLVSSA
jgi:type III secretory pathway component EscV